MNQNSIILSTDSYKLNHWNQYPKDTEKVYSYFESRPGAKFKETVFFGLQAILKKLEGRVVTTMDILEAEALAAKHFGSTELFNRKGWYHIVDDHAGKLPLHIKAVSEGTPVPVGNVLMTVENTCDECFWLTNAVESMLTHVWYPSTIATLSREIKKDLSFDLMMTANGTEGIQFMLHDFGYRGATSDESAAIGGAGHLVNFVGTDTVPAMLLAMNAYSADLDTLAFSVPATEHSVMTARGEDGEFMFVVEQLLAEYKTGILSVVADSYDIYRFVETICKRYKHKILSRDGVFVVRPDSTTGTHTTPEALTAWIVDYLYDHFGGEVNEMGYKVLNPKIRVLWGDGINRKGIRKITAELRGLGYCASNMVFGMGGGLLQKVNRDTQRFAFKSSAQKRSGVWHDVWKEPLDKSKASKKGRLKLNRVTNGFETVKQQDAPHDHVLEHDILQTVFENGVLYNQSTFDEIRERAKLSVE